MERSLDNVTPGGDGWGRRRRGYERVAFRVRKRSGFPFLLKIFP